MTNSFLLNTYPKSLATFVRGKGSILFDDQGKEYLDFLAGIATVSLGHANDEIAQVISKQASTLGHVSNYFENEYTQKVASKINEKIVGESNNEDGLVFFSNSGAEANECAIKIAKRFGGGSRYKILTAKGSFHGRTLATLAATGQPAKHKNFEPLPPYFKYFDFNNIESLKTEIDGECVAVMVEVIQGENGVQVGDQEFLTAAQQLCRDRGLLLIVDEVQTGMCRTGKWFGFQNYNLNPDIVTMAKALGNGFPVGACWSKQSVGQTMAPGDHGSTFGGQPLALSVVNTVFEIMERDNLCDHVDKLGQYLVDQLESTELFSEVRGKGLLIGCDLNRDKVKIDAATLVSKCLENGLIINATGENTIRLAPALNIDESDIDHAVEIIARSAS